MMLVRTPAVKNMYDELPDDAIDIIKDGVRRYADRKTTEEGRVNEAIAEYARRSVEEGKLSKRDAARILKKYGIEYESEQQPRLSVGEEGEEAQQGVRFSVSAEIAKKYPNWMDNQTVDNEKTERGQNTQVATTVGTYKKVGKWVEDNLGKGTKILDASSGLGRGTIALREAGFDVDDIEPYPGKGRKVQPTYGGVDAYQRAMDDGKEYDYIISNAVLNVIPDDWRNGVLHDMAALLKVGGKMFINTRKVGEEKGIKNKIELESPQEVLVGTPDKITSYQRFFTPQELKEYVESELGDGYTVEIAKEANSGTKGLAAVVVTKTGEKQGGVMFSIGEKHRSERDKVNYAIDNATSLVTGKDIKEVRAERRKNEQERKAQAKEIYEKVLSGDFNSLTLQQINDYINDVTPNNPYGRRLSERLPQRVERALYDRTRENAIDALFSRICEGSVGKNERTRPAGRRAVEERKKEALKGWAQATGHWHTDLSEFTDDVEPIGSGTDSDVYLSKDGTHVIKLSKGKPYGKRFRADIDNIPIFNYLFPNSRYEILGYGDFGKGFVRILRQPFVDFNTSEPLTAEERVTYMNGLGFHPINDEKTAFSNDELIVADLQKSNIVRDAGGNVTVIDADCKLYTKDLGGQYNYPPVEEDVEDGASDSVKEGFAPEDLDDGHMTLPQVKKYVQSVKVPERITSMSQAVNWAYNTFSKIKGALNNLYWERGSKDFTVGVLSSDSTNGRKMDISNAIRSSGRVNQYLDLVQPKLYEARDNSESNEARRFFEDQIDECNYARQWYDRAANGDTSLILITYLKKEDRSCILRIIRIFANWN